MSMLAERKRKQKWSLNPRGKYWSEDQNKFGQKMLEKMGWSVGKGLGANEDGITEHVKVSYKNDSKGMGFKETDNQWTEHESNFSQLLNSLSDKKDVQTNQQEILPRIESLEKKSQSSRARVHYHKFTRGKDLSRYSEKDLANIFGKKSLKNEITKSEKEEVNSDKGNISDKNFGVETSNGGNMLDYFKKKLPSYRKYSVNEINKSEKENNNSESDCERPSFGFGFKSNKIKPNFVCYVKENVNCDLELHEKKNKNKNNGNSEINHQEVNNDHESSKKRKHKSDEVLESAFTPLKKKFKKFENLNSLNDEEKIVQTPDKVKKKNKKCKEKNIQDGLVNPAFDPSFNNVETKKQPLEIIMEEEEIVTKEIIQEIGVEEENMELSSKRKKKKKKKETVEEIENVEKLEVNMKTETDKKKRKEKSVENIEKSSDQVKIKKRKFDEEIITAIVNPSFDPNDSLKSSSEIQYNLYEVKRKKKKKEYEAGIENPALNVTDSSVTEEGKIEDLELKNPEETEKKRKKKKSFNEGVDNPTLNVTDDVGSPFQESDMPIMDEEVVLNTVTVVTPAKKEKTQEKNVGRGLRRRKSVRFSDVDQQIFINGADSPANLRKNTYDAGIDNIAFDKFGNHIEENIDSLSKQLDNYQAEVENDLNEAKMEIMVGEMGDPNGENEILPSGDAKLKFKYANFGRIPPWLRRNNGGETNAKRSYRHLIKGDIVLGFKNSNLHEIQGYGRREKVDA